MRLRLDENLPASAAAQLRSLGHDVETVPEEGLAGAKDSAVWNAAQLETRFLVTQDLDFSDLRTFRPGSHSGVLIVRLREPGQHALTRRNVEVFRQEDVPSWTGCLVVATDRKIRIRRPAEDSEP